MNSITLKSLCFEKELATYDILIDDNAVVHNLLINSPSDYTFGKDFCFTNIKIGKERFTKLFIEHYNLETSNTITDKAILLKGQDFIYLKRNFITPKELVGFFRNALAHKNIIKCGDKYILFHCNHKSSKPKIDTMWDLELEIILSVKSLSKFVGLIDFYNSLITEA